MSKELELADFKYVDAYYTKVDGKNSPWKRIEITGVKAFQQDQADNFNCFASIQQFASARKAAKGDHELHIAPLYFDIDYESDPDVARQDIVKLIDFFTKDLDVQEADIRVFFSGSKGFHMLIDHRALGIVPRDNLQKVFKFLTGYLKYRLGTPATDENGKEYIIPLNIDPVVYTSPRMLRLPNSVHQSTRLYKIELTLQEVHDLHIDQIRELAKEPRRDEDLKFATADLVIKLRPKAAQFYADKLTEYIEAAATSNIRYDKDKFIFTKDDPPVCVQDILGHGWKKEGDRNSATVQLCCYFKDAGYSKDETISILTRWVTDFTTAKSGYQKEQRIANTRNVIESVYSPEADYKFGCAFIRSLHGERAPGSNDYDRVPCAGSLCRCLDRRSVNVNEAPVPLHLAATGNAALTGRRVKTRVMVAGKKQTPYIVPQKLEYICGGKKNCKKPHCPLYQIPSGIAYKDLGVADREIITFCGIGDDNKRGIIKQLSGVPSCAKYDWYETENVNIDELLVIPMADNNTTAINFDDVNSGKYVLRKVYAVGPLNIEENKYYEITGYVFPHPKTQEGTIIIESVEPLQDVVDSFHYNDEIKQELTVFQPKNFEVQSIHSKLKNIFNHLTYNVTHIVEREETLLAVLLVYHSVLRFNVPWDLLPIRGWVECVILGDTATGKSAMIDKVMTYAGIGSRVNAESTSRTGLTYKMEQSGSGGNWYIVWGAWPIADKEILWIDEMTGIKKEEYGEMTMARSEGKLEVKRAVTAETSCRVRAILSGNPVGTRQLSEYGQGAEALKEIFNNEDVRRFDFGVFMRTSDVNPELYNKELPTFPVIFTPENLRNNILFAWSRQPDQVVFDTGTLDKVRESATELSKIYGNASDIPLVSPSDQRNKLARLSVALAALTHSVDDTGEIIIVKPAHVIYITEYLKGVYNAPGCGLNYYARLTLREEELTDEKYDRLTAEVKEIDFLKNESCFFDFISLFARQRYLRQGELEAMLNVEKQDIKEMINKLLKLKMIAATTGGYTKTVRFNSYISKCFEKGVFDGMESDND
jgi:hypothetical protein